MIIGELVYFFEDYSTTFFLCWYFLLIFKITSFLSHLIVIVGVGTCCIVDWIRTQTMNSIGSRWSCYLCNLSPLWKHIIRWYNRRFVGIKVGARSFRLHHFCLTKWRIFLGDARGHLSQTICIWDLIYFGESAVPSVISWRVVSLVDRLVAILLWGFHALILSVVNIWSNISILPICWLFRVLWVKYKLLPIVSEVSYAIIEAIDMRLDRFDSPLLIFLSLHFHPEVHEEHVFSMTILKLFLFLFLDVIGTLNTEWVLESWDISILKISGVSHIYIVLVVWHPWVVHWWPLGAVSFLKPLLAARWNPLFETLTVRTLRSSVKNANVLGLLNARFV